MAVVLTAMNRFLNEDDGLQMAFLDGVFISLPMSVSVPVSVPLPLCVHVDACV